MKRVVLIDGKNLAYRVHYTHRNLSSRGFPTGVLYGALANVISMAKRLPGTPFVWCWDGAGETWRHKLAKENYKSAYKGNREASRNEHAADIVAIHRQLPILKKFLVNAGFRVYEIPRLECDDLIGVLAHAIVKQNLFDQVIIYSGDKDFHQFIGKRIVQTRGLDDGYLVYADPDDIKKEYGVSCKQWTQLRAIIGDPSDNIPRLFRGVGPKTAAKLVLAGIDASKEKPPKGVQLQYTIRKNEIDFKKDWHKVHLNYILSRIPTEYHCPHFDRDIRRQLEAIVKSLKRDSFLREQEIVEDEEAFQRMTNFFVKYQMAELLSQRHVLWQLP